MNHYRLYWYNERERNVPTHIMAEGFRFEEALTGYTNSENFLLVFYNGDTIIATLLNWPEAIFLETTIPNVSQ